MNRILVVNVNWIGDVVFSAPVFRALKEKYPQAQVTCLAVPRVIPILQCIEHIDEIIAFDEDGRHKGILGKIDLTGEIRRRKFDAVFLLHRSWTRALMMKDRKSTRLNSSH